MSTLLDFCPAPPAWSLDWATLANAFDWVAAMAECPQDPVWHAEGDVGIHTRMTLEALAALDAWRRLPADERRLVFAACLLHDVAKPLTTRVDPDGRITSRGHSSRGAVRCREILWRDGVPAAARELVCNLVLQHQLPFFLVDREDADALAIRVSWTSRADLLALVAEADARGRVCRDRQQLVDNVELFREYCRERSILSAPWPFRDAACRVAYFRDPTRHPDAPAPRSTRLLATVLSGLPGAGKDTWIARHEPRLPVVSLDAIRAELGIDADGDQGRVAQAARERARGHMLHGQDFVWNATNLSRARRRPLLDLLLRYRAEIRIVHLETTPAEWSRRNRARRDRVPQRALERMLHRWQVPDATEAHGVRHEVT